MPNTLPPGAISIWIGRFLASAPGFSPEQIDLMAYPYARLPEDVSEPVRLTAFRLFGRDHNPAVHYATNGLLIQGLLQIHRDYCLQVHPDCQECALAHNGPRR